MATRSSVFNNHNSMLEQKLIDDLVVESIKIHGVDVNYVPRNTGDLDQLYFEDTISTFSSYTEIEMFLQTMESFEGDQEFLSKFSIEIPNQLKLVVSKTTFQNLIGDPVKLVRPREGDLVVFPMHPLNEDIFQISFVDDHTPFFQLGTTQMYVLTLEKFAYSHETFNTGLALLDNYISSIDNITKDPFAENDVIQAESDAILDFSEINPFSENGY